MHFSVLIFQTFVFHVVISLHESESPVKFQVINKKKKSILIYFFVKVPLHNI